MKKSEPWFYWLLALYLVFNTGLNFVVLGAISRIYIVNEDFRTDITVRSIQKKIEADNIKLPPIKIIKFISAYPYAKPSQMFFTGENLLIFVNLGALKDLSESELGAVIGHEIGHYVLGHQPDFTAHTETIRDDYHKEIEADFFVVKYFGGSAVQSAIIKLVWNVDERNARFEALEDK